jgi:putative heme transporter
MSEHHWLRRRWKLILNIVTIAALCVLVYAIREQLVDTLSNLGKVNAWALLLIFPVEALNYHSQAKLYQGLFGIVGNKLSYRFLFRTSLELNFVNHVFPSGGAAGISYFGLRMRDGEIITGGKATLVQVMKLGLLFVSFEILILLGMLSLAVMGRVSNLTILVGASLSTLLVVSTFVFAYIIGSKARINAFFLTLTKILNRIIQLVRPRHPETINIGRARRLFDDFHDNYQAIKTNYKKLKAPFWWAFMANFTEILAIYFIWPLVKSSILARLSWLMPWRISQV